MVNTYHGLISIFDLCICFTYSTEQALLTSISSVGCHRLTVTNDNTKPTARLVVTGEIVLITEDGKETHLSNAGDTVVQKGGMHAWRNPSSDKWARWVTVLIAAEPAVVNGSVLKPAFVHD